MSTDNEDNVLDVETKKLLDTLAKVPEEVRDFHKKAQNEIDTLGKMTKETKDGADKALMEMNTKLTKVFDDFEKKTNTSLADIEQKIARRGGQPQFEEVKSAGALTIENEEVQKLMVSKRGQAQVTVERKNISSAVGTVGATTSQANSLIIPDRQPMIGLPERRLTVRDLITPGQTNSSSIEYAVEVGTVPPTIGAGMVSEGQLKPQSDLSFNLKSSPVRTVAWVMKASRQILDDAPMLSSFIDGRLRYGLSIKEEDQFLSGDGTGMNLLGIIPQATPYSAAFAPALIQAMDVLRLAALQAAATSLIPSTGYVLHPQDWAKIELLKNTQGNYIVGDPHGRIQPMLWGLPVVETIAMTVNTFLAGAFRLGAQIFDRMAVEVLISTEDADNFQRNMITIRGEERTALAVYRPTGFITGALP